MKYFLDIYFNLHSKQQIDIVDRFLDCCKLIEGYDLREENDEQIADGLEKAIISKMKEEPVKAALSPVFESVGIKYKAKNVAEWIARGHLGRVSLNARIKKYDERFFGTISSNHTIVFRDGYEGIPLLDRVVLTRNYYSHMKKDDEGVLSIKEIYETTNMLLALITSLLLWRIGFTDEGIGEIMNRDRIFGVYIHLPEQDITEKDIGGERA